MLTRPDKMKLHTLIGNYPNAMAMKDGRVKSDLIEWDFADFPVPNRGFKPMVREHRFDCGELAIVTFLQAREFGLPYVLLPATVVGRGQLHTVAYNSERGTMKPSDLNGKKFGGRSYTQTTGIWVRGILAESYGVDWSKVEITTMEDPHVKEYKDPSFVKRAPETKQLPQMLIDGELDAALIGDKFPDPRFKTLVPRGRGSQQEVGRGARRRADQPHGDRAGQDRQGTPRYCRRDIPRVQGGARSRHVGAEGQARSVSFRRGGQPRSVGADHRLLVQAADDRQEAHGG